MSDYTPTNLRQTIAQVAVQIDQQLRNYPPGEPLPQEQLDAAQNWLFESGKFTGTLARRET